MAGELNRDVFAIPVLFKAEHHMDAITHDGVTLVQSMEQLVDELGSMRISIQTHDVCTSWHRTQSEPVESEILDAITPRHADEVINATSYSTPQVIAAISV